MAEVVAAWWRGVTAPAVELKERSLSPAALSKKRGAEELTTGLQAARQLSHGWLWILEHVKAAVADNKICLPACGR